MSRRRDDDRWGAMLGRLCEILRAQRGVGRAFQQERSTSRGEKERKRRREKCRWAARMCATQRSMSGKGKERDSKDKLWKSRARRRSGRRKGGGHAEIEFWRTCLRGQLGSALLGAAVLGGAVRGQELRGGMEGAKGVVEERERTMEMTMERKEDDKTVSWVVAVMMGGEGGMRRRWEETPETLRWPGRVPRRGASNGGGDGRVRAWPRTERGLTSPTRQGGKYSGPW